MSDNDQRWYQQPIAWLGIAIFVASMAGCIHLIVLASTHQDPALPNTDSDISFRIPATRESPDPPLAPANEEP
ncbi:MAG TPA: hypothetical protein VFN25_04065 [Dokdonella sp.]|uniref:hypothetical protein n=1 Tax=Dokdonella sp. TaxID=2291710 RepID=UPI002D7EC821|nr:hypothetical protein [Dokdonella sp.]HET9032064.1 hypothetical protein [Dokdonella sp.]